MVGIAGLAAAADPANYGPVGQETLWTVAGTVNGQRHLGTTAQVAWALFRANPQAFEGTPGKIKPGSTLTIPDATAVTAVATAEAYQKLTGKPAPAAVRAAPLAAPNVDVPRIIEVQVKPLLAGEKQQWVSVIGSGFRPGAKLELKDMLNGTRFAGQQPARLTATRIDYPAAVGREMSNWLITVHNADGTQSEAYGFAAGPAGPAH